MGLKETYSYHVSFNTGEPQGKEGNQKIRDKCKEYLDRVEELKEYSEKKEVFINSYSLM